MKREERYADNTEVSEKAIESYLTKRVKTEGGLALKYYNPNATGYPDRLLLFPGGHAAWCEVKSKGKRLSPLQVVRRGALLDLGFDCFTVDSREKVDAMLSELRRRFGIRETRRGGKAAGGSEGNSAAASGEIRLPPQHSKREEKEHGEE